MATPATAASPSSLPWRERAGLARACFALTAFVVLVGLAIDVVDVIDVDTARFATPAGRIFNLFCFFTIQSNVLVGICTLLLVARLERHSTPFAVLRTTSLVAIVVTGLVYHALLAGDRVLTGWPWVANLLLHTVVPLLAVVGWLAFGPRGLVSRRVVWLTLVFPICWLALTLVRGPIADFYPYPFVDVSDLGYVHVLANCVGIGVLIVALAGGASALDRRLARA